MGRPPDGDTIANGDEPDRPSAQLRADIEIYFHYGPRKGYQYDPDKE